ncbi:Pyrrolo-quinoline quinone [Anopheles sinensis]|uniref:Pyrrolo-quinoline quinone n=1 Tax=Anopheles sinensis TaxID=74873 RepID=A0A084VVC9_ANOSI|nr:Pyrrolo-quinoline quinone [Anopheles sinensis]
MGYQQDLTLLEGLVRRAIGSTGGRHVTSWLIGSMAFHHGWQWTRTVHRAPNLRDLPEMQNIGPFTLQTGSWCFGLSIHIAPVREALLLGGNGMCDVFRDRCVGAYADSM